MDSKNEQPQQNDAFDQPLNQPPSQNPVSHHQQTPNQQDCVLECSAELKSEGPWQTDQDQPTRDLIAKRLSVCVNAKDVSPLLKTNLTYSFFWIHRLPAEQCWDQYRDVVKLSELLEMSLYRLASSLGEYSDLDTIQERLQRYFPHFGLTNGEWQTTCDYFCDHIHEERIKMIDLM